MMYEQCRRLVETGAFLISVYDESEDVATIVFAAGLPAVLGATYRGADSRSLREGRAVLHHSERGNGFWRLVQSQQPVLSSAIAAPLIDEERVTGEIAVFAPCGVAYGAADLKAVETLAWLSAVALGNVRHLEALERGRREAERLEEIGRALVGSLELEEVLASVTSAAISLFDAGGSTVWLLDDTNETVRVAWSAGELSPRLGLKLRVPAQLYEHMRRGEPFVFEDVRNADALSPELRTLTGATSSMGVPLHAGHRLIGALSVGHGTKRHYASDDVRLLQRLGVYAAIAVTNARLHEELRALSLTDPLTGLPNRRQLEIYLEREFAAAIRGRPLAMLVFDLDNFKDYNDFAGHDAGDDALRAIGQLLAGQTRRMNLAARYGGDEFITVLSGADADSALLHADRIAAAIAAHPLLGPLGIRASIGMACFASSMREPLDLIRAADRDMYLRKANRER